MPKPIFFVMVAVVIAIAAVYFYQKKNAEQLIDKLVNDGTISISEKIEALPLVIVDDKNKSIYLFSGNQQQIILFSEIKHINLYKAHDRGNNAGGKIGPDYATITTQSDKQFRFDNLTLKAEALYQLFAKYPQLTQKLKLNNEQ